MPLESTRDRAAAEEMCRLVKRFESNQREKCADWMKSLGEGYLEGNYHRSNVD